MSNLETGKFLMLHGMPGSIKEIRPCSRINQGPADNTLSDSLLILDDVWKPDVIQIFTVPVRILVTTQVKAKFKDVGVMEVVFDHFSLVDTLLFLYLQYETKCLLFFSCPALLSKSPYGCFPTTYVLLKSIFLPRQKLYMMSAR